jgi:hypothetical protein
MLTPVTDLVTGALTEIRVARGGDVVRAEDLALGVLFLNEVLERLPVTPNALYARAVITSPLTPGLAPHTIGPTGTFVVPRRPVRLRSATLEIPPATSLDLPIESAAWFTGQALPSLTTSIPQGLYYNPTWPNGEVHLWPVPSMPYGLTLDTDTEITAVLDTDTIDLPQGYSELLRLWVAKKAAPSFAREFSKASKDALQECLADVFGSNIARVNDLDTRDSGMPGGGGGSYDYRTGAVS